MTTPESRKKLGNNGKGIDSYKPDFTLYPVLVTQACDYLRITQARLSNGYRWDGKKGPEAHCVWIAEDIAKILLPMKPSLLRVNGPLVTRYSRAALEPKCYEGILNSFGKPVTWGNHTVCALEDVIFDPIVGKPMDAHLYQTTVFKSPAILSPFISPNDIANYLENPLL